MNGDESYKYLGVLQADKILHEKAKVRAKKEYFDRVRGILSTGVSASNTTSSIRAFAMPILRYGFGVIKWTQAELRNIDCKTRKILYKHKFHHPKSDIHRLYLSRSKGGRGLVGAHDCHRQECTKIATYLDANTEEDPLVRVVCDAERRKKNGMMQYLEGEEKAGTAETIDDEHLGGLRGMKMHGDFFRQREEAVNIDVENSDKWLEQSHLRFETESLVCAAQEQTLATKYMTSKIWANGHDTKCRLCKEHHETVHHIVAGCKMLAGTKYTYRHNQVAKYVHWCILMDKGINVTESWLNHKPESVTTKDDVIIMWDTAIITDKNVKSNRPDITVHDSKNKKCMFIDISVPGCHNVVKKEAEKIVKYRDLEIEVQKCWNLKEVSTIPVVIGALGTVCNGLANYIHTISPRIEHRIMKKNALLGTARILRNFLKPQKIQPLNN